jgi:hypothetical protein
MKTSHIHTSLIIGLLCGLSCLLSSCEKELLSEGTGRKVAVDFSVTGNDYIDDTRSSVAQAPELGTTIIPLGDGLYLRATLTEEPVNKLRATVALAENQKVRLAAFRGTTSTQEGVSADYVYSGGKLVPVNNLYPLLVDENATYNFVAYSYFNETAVYPPLENIPSDKQLLWGTSGQKAITTSGSTVSISMVQKFAQAKVSISTSKMAGTPNITAVSGVTITCGGNRNKLSLHDGALSTGTPLVVQAVTFPSFSPASTVTSNYRTIYPVNSGVRTTLSIGNITINGVGTLTNIEGEFTQVLLEGHSYILTLDLKGVAFAGSNVYWNGTQLTFELYDYVGEKNFYQGLHFKWGSLIGASPKNVTFQTSDMIYYPTSKTTWAAIPLSSSGYAVYGDIPAMSFATAAARGTGWANDYVTNGYALDNGNQPFNYAGHLGDICRVINDGYRYPTAEEMYSGNTTATLYNGWVNSSAVGWAKGTNSTGGSITFPAEYTGVLDEKGISVLDYDTYGGFGGGFATYKGVAVFPASGIRAGASVSDPPPSTRSAVGSFGYYMTGSSQSAAGSYILQMANNYLFMIGNGDNGFPVRCVKN